MREPAWLRVRLRVAYTGRLHSGQRGAAHVCTEDWDAVGGLVEVRQQLQNDVKAMSCPALSRQQPSRPSLHLSKHSGCWL